MLIGIISDSHDDMAQIAKAVEYLNAKNIPHVIHAGDIVSPFTFEVLNNLTAQFTGIFGNNDGDRVLLKEKSNGRIHIQPHTLSIDNKRIAVVHEPLSVSAMADSGHFDVVIYGHTHMPEIRKAKNALVINPGKLAKLHKGKSTLALLDTSAMTAEIVEM